MKLVVYFVNNEQRGVWGRKHVSKKAELKSRFVRVLVLK